MVQSLINLFDIRKELLNYLRNQDILTIGNRGVITGQDTGTFSADTSYLINQPNVKNIRSVIRGSTLTYGADYTVDFTFDDTGTTKTKISFTSAQTGSYTINYDYGTDKIWPDYPRDDLNISSYPRVSVDVIGATTDVFGIGGNEDVTDITFSITVFGQDIQVLDDLITAIRTKILNNRSSFYYFKFMKPIGIGPLIEDDKRQEILRRNVDFTSIINVEKIQ